MFILKNTATATKRRAYLALEDESGDPWDGTVTGIKAQLSFNGGAEAASTNDIVKVAAGYCYIELTQGESDTAAGSLHVRIPAATGLRQYHAIYPVLVDDPTVAASTTAAIAAAVTGTELGTKFNDLTILQGLKVLLSLAAAKATGLDGATPTFRNLDDTGTVVTTTGASASTRGTPVITPDA